MRDDTLSILCYPFFFCDTVNTHQIWSQTLYGCSRRSMRFEIPWRNADETFVSLLSASAGQAERLRALLGFLSCTEFIPDDSKVTVAPKTALIWEVSAVHTQILSLQAIISPLQCTMALNAWGDQTKDVNSLASFWWGQIPQLLSVTFSVTTNKQEMMNQWMQWCSPCLWLKVCLTNFQ